MITEIPITVFRPLRLMILMHLNKNINKSIRHRDLMHMLNIREGTLTGHLRVLEKEGFVAVHHIQIGKRLRSYIQITKKGREMLVEFHERMKDFLKNLK